MLEISLWALDGLCTLLGYVSGKSSFPPALDAQEEAALLERWQQGDPAARDSLIEHNLRLVAHIVKKYGGNGRDMDDLISIGSIGLIKGISTYDPGRGVGLSTYASRCIENEVLMSLRKDVRHRDQVSLQSPVGRDKEGNPVAWMELLEQGSGDGPDVVDTVELRLQAAALAKLLHTRLTARERLVIEGRYGLSGDGPHTQKEVAAMLGISRSYVSRIEKKALSKLRRAMQPHQ